MPCYQLHSFRFIEQRPHRLTLEGQDREGVDGPSGTEGTISALNIPHSSMMFDHYETKEIRTQLPGQKGVAIETVRFADLASLRAKAFALDQGDEPKDADDIIYCHENAEDGPVTAAAKFREGLKGKHANAVADAKGHSAQALY